MKTKTLITAAAIVILTASLPLFSQEKKPEPSGTWNAKCIIKVDVAREILAGNEESILQNILSSTNVGGKIGKEIMGFPAGTAMIDIKPISRSSIMPNFSTYLFSLSVDYSRFTNEKGIKPVAEEFLDALVDALRKTLEKFQNDYRENYNLQMQIAVARSLREEDNLKELQKKLREISAPYNLSREVIMKDISSITEELRNTKSRESMIPVRRGNLDQQIAEIRGNVEEQIKNSPILDDMKKIVDIEANKLDKIRELVKKGQLSEENLFDAQSKLARARIELAQKEQEIKDAAGGLRISQLMEELNNINLMQAETEEKIKDLNRQLVAANNLMERVDEYEIILLKVNAAKLSLEKALERVNETKQGFIDIAPTVKIAGSEE